MASSKQETSTAEDAAAKATASAPASASTTVAAAAAAATGGVTVPRGGVNSSQHHHQHKAPEETAQMSVLGMNDTDDYLKKPPPPPQQHPPPRLGADSVDDGDKKMPAATISQQRSRTGSNSNSNNNGSSNGISSAPPRSPQQTPRTNNNAKKKVGDGIHRNKNHNNKRKPSAAVVNRSWWDKILWGGQKDELGRTTNYTSLETPTSGSAPETPGGGGGGVVATVASARSHPLPRLERFEDEQSTSNSSTVEDQVRQDCSFFYQGVEDPIQQKRGAAFPIPSSATSGNTSSLDRVPSRVLSSRDGAIFHAKYQKLNRVIHVNDDLELTVEDPDEEQPPSVINDNDSSRNISISDIQNSTLIYKYHGRVHMRLPRDQIRLVMDPDLEPGILSVEQWRCGVDANEILPDGNAVATTGPALRYVMTVPDDLYRRLISEMSYGMNPPYAGFCRFCHDSETHADIRLALIIISVVLFFLFIGTMDYRTT